MSIRIQTFELISLLVACIAKEKVITILTHPASFQDHLFTVKALILLLFIKLWLKHGLKLVMVPMSFRVIHPFMPWSLKEAFLA